MLRRTCLVAIAALALLAPATAHAVTFVQYDQFNGLTLTGDGSDSSGGVFIPAGDGSTYRYFDEDPNAFFIISGCTRTVDPSTAGAPNREVADCQITGPRRITATLAGGKDNLDLSGDVGTVTVSGGPGNDRLGGERTTGPVSLDGGDDQDLLVGGPGGDTLIGGPGPDNLHLNPGADDAQGGAGNDTFVVIGNPAVGGNPEPTPAPDRIDGGPDTDLALYDGTENFNLSLDNSANDGRPGEGDNLIAIENIESGSGNDTITGDAGPNVISGESRNAFTNATPGGNDVIHGGDGNDRLSGHAGNDQVFGDGGGDGVYGGSGNDVVDGGDGNDAIGDDNQSVVVGGFPPNPAVSDTGPDGDDTVRGGDGADFFNTHAGVNVLEGGAGDDQVSASNTVNGSTFDLGVGNDKLLGLFGDVTINGGAGNDILFGGPGSQTIDGGAGDDMVNGLQDNDIEKGGSGDDIMGTKNLTGGISSLPQDRDVGVDVMQGGAGADEIVSVDGQVDNVDCGTNPIGVINKPGLNDPENDKAIRDLVDTPVVNCEAIQNGNRNEGPFVKIARAKVALGQTVALRLSCPAKLKIACAGTLQTGVLDRNAKAGGLGAKLAYSIAHGASRVLRVPLRNADRAKLRADKRTRLRVVSIEKGEFGPKTIVAILGVKR